MVDVELPPPPVYEYITPSNMKVTVAANNKQPGVNILIDQGSRGTTNGLDGNVLIASGPGSGPGYVCTIGTRVAIGGTLVKGPIGLQLVSVNLIHLPGYAVLSVNGTEYQVTGGTYVDVIGGRVGVFGITMTGACIDIQLSTAPGPTPGPGPVPTLPVEPAWDFSSISATFQSLWEHIKWLLMLILSPVTSILDWIAKIADYLLHLSDHLDAWISRLFGVDPAGPFFDQVMHNIDIWVSNRLGVDPDKPLLEELLKKVFAYFTGWLSALVDDDENNLGRIH